MFSLRGQIAHIFSSVGQAVSVATTLLNLLQLLNFDHMNLMKESQKLLVMKLNLSTYTQELDDMGNSLQREYLG